jgi:hypothetical protein
VAIILSVSTAGVAIQKAPSLFGAECPPIEDHKWREIWVYVAKITPLLPVFSVFGKLSISLISGESMTAEEIVDDLLYWMFFSVLMAATFFPSALFFGFLVRKAFQSGR